MDITWYGQSCIRIKGKQATLVIDPFNPAEVGIKLPKLAADTVLVTHQHADHNYIDGVTALENNDTSAKPVVIAGPGEYEIKGVTIVGIPMFHDAKHGEERGKNTVYQCIVDGISIVHMGDIGHTLTKEQVASIDACDILCIPVGGVFTLEASDASEIISQLEPSIVIPMHYALPSLKVELEPLDKFLKVIGKEQASPQAKLTITKDKLPGEVETVILEKQ